MREHAGQGPALASFNGPHKGKLTAGGMFYSLDGAEKVLLCVGPLNFYSDTKQASSLQKWTASGAVRKFIPGSSANEPVNTVDTGDGGAPGERAREERGGDPSGGIQRLPP